MVSVGKGRGGRVFLWTVLLFALPFCLLANSTAGATRHRPSGVPPSGSITGCLLKCNCTAKIKHCALPLLCMCCQKTAGNAPRPSTAAYVAPKNPSMDFSGIGDLLSKSPRRKAALHGSILFGKKEKPFPELVEGNIHQKIFVNNRGS